MEKNGIRNSHTKLQMARQHTEDIVHRERGNGSPLKREQGGSEPSFSRKRECLKNLPNLIAAANFPQTIFLIMSRKKHKCTANKLCQEEYHVIHEHGNVKSGHMESSQRVKKVVKAQRLLSNDVTTLASFFIEVELIIMYGICHHEKYVNCDFESCTTSRHMLQGMPHGQVLKRGVPGRPSHSIWMMSIAQKWDKWSLLSGKTIILSFLTPLLFAFHPSLWV